MSWCKNPIVLIVVLVRRLIIFLCQVKISIYALACDCRLLTFTFTRSPTQARNQKQTSKQPNTSKQANNQNPLYIRFYHWFRRQIRWSCKICVSQWFLCWFLVVWFRKSRWSIWFYKCSLSLYASCQFASCQFASCQFASCQFVLKSVSKTFRPQGAFQYLFNDSYAVLQPIWQPNFILNI